MTKFLSTKYFTYKVESTGNDSNSAGCRPSKITVWSADAEMHSVQRLPTFSKVNHYRPVNFIWSSD